MFPQGRALFYVTFIIDACARVIVGWRVSSTAHTNFVLDTLEQALPQKQPEGKVTHHSDKGSQYVSFATRKGWMKRASLPLLEALGFTMIMPSQRPLTGFIKPNSSISKNHGKTGKLLI